MSTDDLTPADITPDTLRHTAELVKQLAPTDVAKLVAVLVATAAERMAQLVRERDEARTQRDVAYARADELRDEVRYWIKIVNLGGDPGAHWPSGDPKEEHSWEVEQ